MDSASEPEVERGKEADPSCVPQFVIDQADDGVNRESFSDEEYFDAPNVMPDEGSSSEAQSHPVMSHSISVITMEGDPPEIEEDKDYHEINNVDGLVTSNRSMIIQLLSQIRIGMDLTRIVLPAFIFEKRSLLEMYAEFFSHPDLILRASTMDDPLDRMIGVTKWFLSSLSASRKVGVPKKPYNPILGEVFCCYWDVPGGKRTAPNEREKLILEGGPPIGSGYDSLSFIAEQVSHHPPVSAFYVECPSKRVFMNATAEAKTKFQGLSVKIQNNGLYELHFMDKNEVYEGDFPNGYVRSLLTTPWFEFGGPATIRCKESGYTCHMDFHTKPFRGGHKHRITADIRHDSRSKAILKLEGFWTNVISKKITKHTTEQFLDARTMPTIRKKVKKFALQEPHESRIVWRHLTAALEREDSEAASLAKHEVEEAQREKAREFKLTGLEWEAKHFVNERRDVPYWMYKNNLKERLKNVPQS